MSIKPAMNTGDWVSTRVESRLHLAAASPIADESKAMVEIEGVHYGYGDTLILKDIHLTIPQGQFVALVGVSGCGKTTLLNLVAGQFPGMSGQISIAGQRIKGPRLSTGYMSARDALMSWRTALDNVAFGLELRGVSKDARLSRAKDWLARVGLIGSEGKYRNQLSQGMRQRVAFARTLAIDPDLVLLDEPFAALDAQTKEELQPKFLQLCEGGGRTVILVTHDINEAISMADRVVVLSKGRGISLDQRVVIPRPRNIADLIDVPEFRDIRHRVREALFS